MGKSRAEARRLKQRSKKRQQGCPSERLRTSQRYKSGHKTETPRLEPGRSFQREYSTTTVRLVKATIRAKERKVKNPTPQKPSPTPPLHPSTPVTHPIS